MVSKAPPKPLKKRPAISILRASDDHLSLAEISIYVIEISDKKGEIFAEKESTSKVFTLETLGSGFSVS